MIKKITLLLLLILSSTSNSQNAQLSVFSEISVITSGPGDNLYEKFGHTAIRLKDPVLNLDLIYNYGMFDFNAPNFYSNFAKGRLNYKLARYPFHYFVKCNKEDKRWIKEQILDITLEQKKQFFAFLEHNVMPENATYAYDPFSDNCATKIPFVIKEIVGENNITFDKSYVEDYKSIRKLMNQRIHQDSWGSLGINLALGSKIDKKATAQDYLYLPDYVLTSLTKSKITVDNQTKPLVKKTNTILSYDTKSADRNTIGPNLIFTILLTIILLISNRDYKQNKRTKWLDFTVFFSTGFAGLILLYLWFLTDHRTTPLNTNVLWAFAPNIIVGFILMRSNIPNWIRKYLILLCVLIVVALGFWISGIQQFTWSIFLLILCATVRYIYLLKLLPSKK